MPLSDCFVDLFAYVAYGTQAPDALPASCDDLARTLDKLIVLSEDKRVAGGYPREDYDLARFAVFVWIDETIMKSEYRAKGEWRKHLLQRSYYKTTGGGVEFYRRLDALEADQDSAREVYVLCLALGYSGRYGVMAGDQAVRDTIKSRQLKRLTGSSDALTISGHMDKMFPNSYAAPESSSRIGTVRRKGFSLIGLCLCLAPVGVFAFMYVLYRFILNNEITAKLVH